MISIIVPSYNVEAYLPRCVDSILAQTYTDWELILVNDGSKDGTGAVIDEYASKDARIHAVHQENGGVSSARNKGMESMTGEYVIFLDSDDWIEPDMFEKMLDAFDRNHSDFVACDCYRIDLYEDGTEKRIQWKKWGELHGEKITEGKDTYYSILLESATLWNKLFCTKNIKELRFNEKMSFGEDTDFLMRAMINGNKATILAYAGYNYVYNRPGNVQTGGVKKNLIELIVNSYILYEMIRDEKCGSLGVYRLYRMIDKVLCKMPLDDCENQIYKEYYEASKRYARKTEFKDQIAYLLDQKIPMRDRKRFVIICISPLMYVKHRRKKLQKRQQG